MPDQLDRESLDELLRLAKDAISGNHAALRLWDEWKNRISDRFLVSLIELAREGLAAREGKQKSAEEDAGLQAIAMRWQQESLTAPPPKGPNDDSDQR